MPASPEPPPAPSWLSPATLAAARDAGRTSSVTGGHGGRNGRAVHDTIAAHHPALPMTFIAEAVAYVLGLE
jgi:hypothetical protein